MHVLNRMLRAAYALFFLLTACAGNDTLAGQVTAEAIITPTVTLTPSTTPPPTTPAPDATSQVSLVLSIWLPEPLAPTTNPEVQAILTSQLNAFQAAEPGISVEVRLKRPTGQGSVISTLLSAHDVAPNATPSLTLIRRADLAALVQAGLLLALDEHISDAILEDLYPAAAQLGQYREQQYGLPFALEVQHVAYQPPPANFARFQDMLESERSLVLPAGNVSGINDVFLVQYLSAGGTIVEGTLAPLDLDALREVLEFYEQALTLNRIDSSILNYPTPQDYGAGLVDGRITAAVVTSSMYLDLLETDESWQTGVIPLASDAPATTVDGWLWVLTAADSDHQAAALRFLDWVFNPQRQAAYTWAIRMLPSARAAFRTWGTPPYAQFTGNLLNNAVLPLTNNDGNATARAMQSAFVSVISGERTAAQATQDVANQLGVR
jgi:ABC-type glycerol-3-phosphate transport system substrate-binding protein